MQVFLISWHEAEPTGEGSSAAGPPTHMRGKILLQPLYLGTVRKYYYMPTSFVLCLFVV